MLRLEREMEIVLVLHWVSSKARKTAQSLVAAKGAEMAGQMVHSKESKMVLMMGKETVLNSARLTADSKVMVNRYEQELGKPMGLCWVS